MKEFCSLSLKKLDGEERFLAVEGGVQRGT